LKMGAHKLPGLALIEILLISASQVTRITDVSHQCPATIYLLSVNLCGAECVFCNSNPQPRPGTDKGSQLSCLSPERKKETALPLVGPQRMWHLKWVYPRDGTPTLLRCLW
jgi:hypothetical protein